MKRDNNHAISHLSLLIQMSDSAFPVGTFSFSNGLETAAYEGIVHDADTLEQFARAAARQAAFTDGIAALASFHAAAGKDFERVKEADAKLFMTKMNDEARLMLQRMGKKLAELCERLFPSDMTAQWLAAINGGLTPGTFPAAQGIAFAEAGLDDKSLFASHQYGVVNMVLGAALRCVRVSHYDTQRILFRLASEADALFSEVCRLGIDDMNCFVPQTDVLASLHEKGNMRMFMS